MDAPSFTNPADVPADCTVLCKPRKCSKKTAWRSMPLAEVPAMVSGWSPSLFASGKLALWVSARSETETGKVYFPWIDVEDHVRHDDMPANIETAQNLYIRLAESGLDDGLVVLLTGRGFRFCWPWAVEPELAGPFMVMLRDSRRWPGIDDGPQVTGMPLALAGYRGDPAQGSKGDVHFHRLAEASDLLTLTPAVYDGLVAGPADLAVAVETMNSIMPRSWTPPAWREVLAEYARDLELRRNILRLDPPARPEPPAAVPWAVLENHLAGLNIRVVRELELSRGTVRNLDRCPVCGKAGKAFLAAGGRLKCFSSGCAAGQVAVDLRGEAFRPGLPLREWAAEIAPAGHDDAELVERIREDEDDTATTIDAARAAIREALAGEDPALLLEVTAGIGKTTAAEAYAIEQAGQGKTVLFAAPSIALAEEIHDRMTRAVRGDFNILTPPRLYKRRSKDNCKKIESVNKAVSFGYSPGLLFCIKCFHKGHCPYQRQFEPFERGGIIVASHDAMPTVVGKLPPDLLVIDENPRDAIFKTEPVTAGDMAGIRAHIVGDAEAAFDKITAAASDLHRAVVGAAVELRKKELSGRLCAGEFPKDADDKRPVPPQNLWEAAGITKQERQSLESQLWAYMQFEGEAISTWQKRLFYDHRINLLALNWLWSALGDIPRQSAYVSASARDREPIMYCYTRMQELAGNFRIVALDATPDVKELNALLGREFTTVKATVPPKKGARLVHLRVAMGKTKSVRLADCTLLGYLKKSAAYLKPTDRKVLIVTHQRTEEKLLAMARQLDPSREWASCHHFAAKGLNAWEGFDAGLVIGTPTAPVAAYFDKGVAIHGDDVAARQAWLAGLGMRDLIQSVSRLRPVLRPKSVIVVGRHWPAEALGQPSFIVDESRKGGSAAAMEEAYRRLLPLAQHFGVMFSELAHVAGVFRKQDTAEMEIWREKIQPETGGETTSPIVPTLISNILLRVGTMEKGLSQPIQFRHRADWSELIARLADATGLPEIEYRPRTAHGGARPQAAIGSAAAVAALCQAAGEEYLPELWTFHEPETETAPAQEEQRTMTKPADPLAAALAVREPFTADAMTRPPGVPPDAYFPPLAARLCAEVA